MKRTKFLAPLIFLLAILLGTPALAIDWYLTDDLAGATATHVLLEASDGYVYSGTGWNGDVFKTNDLGETWTNTADLPGAMIVLSLAEDSNGDLYAGTYANGRVYKSTDGGATWSLTGILGGNPPVTHVNDILEAADGCLYAATGFDISIGLYRGDVYKSCNGGTTWTNTGDLSGAEMVLTLEEDASGNIYAGTFPNGYVFKTTNGGTSWTGVSVNGVPCSCTRAIYDVLYSTTEDCLYAGTYPDGDVFKSCDAGATWTNTTNISGAIAIRTLMEHNDGTIFAGSYPDGEVFYSTDGGTTWTYTAELSGAMFVYDLIQASDDTIYVSVGYTGDVFIDKDPTIIELISFGAREVSNKVSVTWATASETDNAGFHLWRSDSANGIYEQITVNMIPAQGDPSHGAIYGFTDADVENGETYYYKLEDINVFGGSSANGPVDVTLANPRFCGAVSQSSGAVSLGLLALAAIATLLMAKGPRTKKSKRNSKVMKKTAIIAGACMLLLVGANAAYAFDTQVQLYKEQLGTWVMIGQAGGNIIPGTTQRMLLSSGRFIDVTVTDEGADVCSGGGAGCQAGPSTRIGIKTETPTGSGIKADEQLFISVNFNSAICECDSGYTTHMCCGGSQWQAGFLPERSVETSGPALGTNNHSVKIVASQECGNGALDAEEECEDALDCDPVVSAAYNCVVCECVAKTCGDGIVSPERGEQCETADDCTVGQSCTDCQCTD